MLSFLEEESYIIIMTYFYLSFSCSAIYTLILHLSIADLLVTIFCIGGESIWSYAVAWIWGNVACKVFKFLQMFSLYLSTFVLVLIGVDRFVAVRYPMKSLNTAQRCKRLVMLTWILSFILSIPQVRNHLRSHVGHFLRTINQSAGVQPTPNVSSRRTL